MTSRDVSRGRLQDSLDAMIRWVLRENAGDPTPPPEVWERINERLTQQAGMKRAALWRGFRLAEPLTFLLLAVSAVGAQAELPYFSLGEGDVWGGNPLYLTDQYGILLRRLAVL